VARKKAVTDLASCDAYQLYKLANNGNSDALELLRKQLRDKPELARVLGDMAWQARQSRLNQILGDYSASKLMVDEAMNGIAKQVAGENPSPLEAILAERVAACWLDVQDHECRYAQQCETFKQQEWRSKMLDRAQQRYLSAIKTLAMIRKLPLPVVQVNIADKQINTTG
jgi:hypothetical protein